ncbi:DoxX family protein [Mucilaginibacter sp. PAMB04168]|uniref:DoxX family protein n=1 Tax=Mucilaginibacter sp. PAMB04168 TaxID=3138567 RepID=UPI0031F614D5
MNMVQKVEHWGDLHHTKWLEVVRILLGLIIFSKGVTFISQTQVQQDWIIQNSTFGVSGLMAMVVIHTVALVHLVGGLLIMIGLITRFAVVIQIPILLGAILFVNSTRGLSFINSELWLSIVVLLLLIVCWVTGSGPYSLDHWIKNGYQNYKTQPRD